MVGNLMTTRETPGGLWLPIAPARSVVPNGSFPANISEWSVGVIDPTTARYYLSLGTFGTTGSGNTNFDTPAQTVVDASGNTYTADTVNNRAIKRNSAGTFLLDSTVAGGVPLTGVRGMATAGSEVYAASNGGFAKMTTGFGFIQNTTAAQDAIHLATDGTYVYGTRPGNTVIKTPIATWTGASSVSFGSAGSGNGQFNAPWGIVYFGGELYVVDSGNSRVQVFNLVGTYQRQWAIPANSRGITVDGAGRLLVAVFGSDQVRVYSSVGALLGTITQTDPDGVSALGDILWVTNATDDNLTKWQGFDRAVSRSWNNVGAVGAALGALAVSITNGQTADQVQTLNSKYFQINERESVDVTATVRTTDANFTPRLQLLFYNAANVLISTATEADWTPVASARPRRSFVARVPTNATQYRIGFLAVVDAGPLTAEVYLDDVTTGAPELIVNEIAMGTLKITAQVRGRWL